MTGSTAEELNNFSLRDFVRETIINYSLFDLKKDTIVLAVSGGIDSMVLLDILHSLQANVVVAHCNFGLRPDAAEDEVVVRDYCEDKSIPCHSKHFDTKVYASQKRISTQEAARNLRYAWFEELANEVGASAIATAHHARDSVETFFINLMRGSGLQGLSGIPIKNGKVVRPMLHSNYDDILNYQKENNISFHEDSTNQSEDYLRNKIRHNLLPILDKIDPYSEQPLFQSIENLSGEKELMEDLVNHHLSNFTDTKNGQTWIKKEIFFVSNSESLIYWILKKWNFNHDVCREVRLSLESIGNTFFSSTHRLVVDRENLIIEELNKPDLTESLVEFDKNQWRHPSLDFELKVVDNIEQKDTCIGLSKKLISLPLKVRFWREGDRFHPAGMGGKSQKLKKFFVNEKINRFEKEITPLLVDAQDRIIWVMPYRQDENYKGTDLYIAFTKL